MKYEDGPAVEVEVHIDASPAVVWDLISDITLPARFSLEFQGGDWLDGADGGQPAIGARFVGRNRHQAIGEWQTTCIVVACDRDRVFGWAVGDADNPSASWTFEIDNDDGGGVRLRQRARLGPAPSGLTPAIRAMPDKEERIIGRRLEEHRVNMQATVDGIKAIAERP